MQFYGKVFFFKSMYESGDGHRILLKEGGVNVALATISHAHEDKVSYMTTARSHTNHIYSSQVGNGRLAANSQSARYTHVGKAILASLQFMSLSYKLEARS